MSDTIVYRVQRMKDWIVTIADVFSRDHLSCQRIFYLPFIFFDIDFLKCNNFLMGIGIDFYRHPIVNEKHGLSFTSIRSYDSF
jgi:hypothetical protein